MARRYADWIKAYTDAFTPKGEAPERFHYWTAVSTIAGALRRRVYIDEGTYRYYANFYIILVGPPGIVKKSTTIGVGKSLLRQLPNVNIGADNTTWQAFVEEVAQAHDMFAEGDPTGDMMTQEHTVTCALTSVISEFGTFFDPEDRAMVNVLTELYDCKIDDAFRKATKTQGEDVIMNPFVNLIAGTTPDWMKDNFRGKFGGWGLSSRCIFLHCDEPERNVAYPHKVWRGDYDSTMTALREDLVEIAKLQGCYVLTPAAEAFGETWYDEHRTRQTTLNRHPNHDPWLSYYLARKFDHVHKLSIVLAASRRTTLWIELIDIQDAVKRCDQIEEELGKVFQSRQTGNRDAKLNMDVWNGLASGIRAGGKITEREAYSFTIRWMTYGRAKELLDHLVVSHWLIRESGQGGPFLSFGENAQAAEAATTAKVNGSISPH